MNLRTPFLLAVALVSLAGTILSADDSAPNPPAAADPALRDTIAKSFRVQLLRDTNDPTLVEVMIQVDQPPADMAFDAAIQAGDQTFPVGPFAWKKGGIGWWAYDVDLPEGLKRVDVLFTPSQKALDQLSRDDAQHDNGIRLSGVKTFWTGDPILHPNVEISTQEIGMIAIRPELESGHEDPMDLADSTDPAIQQWAQDGDRTKAKAQLQQRAITNPDDRATLYNLACVVAADGDLDGAMRNLSALRALGLPPDLTPKVQRLLRMICGMNLYRARQNKDAPAMRALGEAYENGYGVAQRFETAKRWYRDGANAGNILAMCHLAAMYDHEIGATVQTDDAHAWYRSQALEWYRKAAALGNAEAKQWLASHDSH